MSRVSCKRPARRAFGSHRISAFGSSGARIWGCRTYARRPSSRFLKDRARTLLPNRAERPALLRCLTLLRQIGVVPPAVLVASTERQRIQGEFRDHAAEAGLSPRSVARYLPYIRRCLSEWSGNRPLDWTTLCAADVIDCVRRQHMSGLRHAQLMVTAMRSFFRYLRFRADITVDLAASVPAVARWKLATLPPSLSAKQVRDMLSHCDRQSRVGRRDYAILLLVSRLGLRSREVIELKLDDVDWREGEIVIGGQRQPSQPSPSALGGRGSNSRLSQERSTELHGSTSVSQGTCTAHRVRQPRQRLLDCQERHGSSERFSSARWGTSFPPHPGYADAA